MHQAQIIHRIYWELACRSADMAVETRPLPREASSKVETRMKLMQLQMDKTTEMHSELRVHYLSNIKDLQFFFFFFFREFYFSERHASYSREYAILMRSCERKKKVTREKHSIGYFLQCVILCFLCVQEVVSRKLKVRPMQQQTKLLQELQLELQEAVSNEINIIHLYELTCRRTSGIHINLLKVMYRKFKERQFRKQTDLKQKMHIELKRTIQTRKSVSEDDDKNLENRVEPFPEDLPELDHDAETTVDCTECLKKMDEQSLNGLQSIEDTEEMEDVIVGPEQPTICDMSEKLQSSQSSDKDQMFNVVPQPQKGRKYSLGRRFSKFLGRR
ncbi:uncharacterized protein LOC125673136 isoform X1 [Ostrea edulis]|uniref:uncharacterized protein LOC125673136 isoform X1 n=1 Tax=Ostrea edulis TaxID=37623 RepID=UPI0024AE8A84|nr:uncharacterized protein LOC125673136 isoform X1 [Ostrea edulis]